MIARRIVDGAAAGNRIPGLLPAQSWLTGGCVLDRPGLGRCCGRRLTSARTLDERVRHGTHSAAVGAVLRANEVGEIEMRMHMARIAIGLIAVLLMMVGLPGPEAAAGPGRPDVIVIVTDDVPALDDRIWQFLPTIRELFVRHGVEFTNFQGESPLCCPGRAGFLTGQHTWNHGVTHNDVRLFDPSVSLATEMQQVGYRTFLAGKYFNRYPLIAPSLPPGWNGFHGYAGGYYDYTMWNNGHAPGEFHGTAPKDYSTDVIAAKALNELRKTPPGQRIFGWISPYASHGPTTPAPRYLHDARCDNVPAWAPANYNEQDVSDKPQYIQAAPLLKAPAYNLTTTCRTLLAVDDLVAAVRDELARQGRLDNTVFILTTDNGMNAGAHRLLAKGTPYATPISFFVSWPQALGTRRRTIDEPLMNIDLAPTVCELTGCTMGPYPNGQQTPDGRSFARILLDRSRTLGRDALVQDMPDGTLQVPPWYAVETTRASKLAGIGCESAPGRGCLWHYVEYATGERELYDVSNGPCWRWHEHRSGDPCELVNLAGNPTYALIQKALARRLDRLKQERGTGQVSARG